MNKAYHLMPESGIPISATFSVNERNRMEAHVWPCSKKPGQSFLLVLSFENEEWTAKITRWKTPVGNDEVETLLKQIGFPIDHANWRRTSFAGTPA